jgi:hypothetical protein
MRSSGFGLVAPLPIYDGRGFVAPILEMGPGRTPVAVFSNGRAGSSAGDAR